MRMLLHPEYPNGPFGDPALYIWQVNEKDALLVDCGDLTRFTPKQLLKTYSLFLSHCHIDHFFGFDLFLRSHMGSEKTVALFGPPQTSDRVGGKLQGYTWNLIGDQNLEFVVTDLDSTLGKKTITHFHARDAFRPSLRSESEWNPQSPVLDTDGYTVHAATLDHRTPSIAYAFEEKVTTSVNLEALADLKLKPGVWIGELKEWYLFHGRKEARLSVPHLSGEIRSLLATELSDRILVPRQRHKVVYATDGAANHENRSQLLNLIQGAELFFSETCFLQRDVHLADDTKHFTAQFIGQVAEEAQVKMLAPIHFSKRYLGCPEEVIREVSTYFQGEVLKLSSLPRRANL